MLLPFLFLAPGASAAPFELSLLSFDLTNDARLGDVDGDGDADVVCANSFTSKMGWLRNDGGALAFGGVFPGTIDANSVGPLADLDGDGRLDALRRGVGEAGWQRNRGGGEFGAFQQLATSPSPSLSAADLDGDGDVDVYVASYTADAVVLENLGGGVFAPPIVVGTTGLASATADVDLDGDPDLLLSGGGDVRWIENLGGGAWAAEAVLVPGRSANLLKVVDLDRDGIPELVDGVSDSYEILELGLPIAPSVASFVDTDDLAIGDGDGDGLPDLWFLDQLNDEVHWERNLGGFAFDPPVLAVEAEGGAIADLDGDGRVDLVDLLEHQVVSAPAVPPAAIVPVDLPIDGLSPKGIADVDGVGAADLLFVGVQGLYWMEGPPALHAPTHLVEPDASEIIDVVAADVDVDGDTDLVASDQGDVALYPGLGGGAFGPKVILASFGVYPEIALGDDDGDGDVDVRATDSALVYAGSVYRIENLGGGAFAAPVAIGPAPAACTGIRSFDMDGDGDLDLLSLSSLGVVVHVDAGGSLLPTTVLTSDQPSDGALLDLEGDGDLDVVWSVDIPNVGVPGLYTAAQTAPGVFAAATLIGGDDVGEIHVVDLDLDGFPDLFARNKTQDSSRWLRNDGFGGFAMQPALSRPALVQDAADVDGDGDPDLIVGGPPGVGYAENLQIP